MDNAKMELSFNQILDKYQQFADMPPIELVRFEMGFQFGYPEGYKAAGEWVRIETADDLPKVSDEAYWFTRRTTGMVERRKFWESNAKYYVEEFSAWMPMQQRPEPFTEPLTEQIGKTQDSQENQE